MSATWICASCGVWVEPASNLPAVFFAGRRYVFCGSPCRLDFKRDPAAALLRVPDSGMAPTPEGPAPSVRRGLFSVRAKPEGSGETS
jgi:YHS domain-containing protein